MMWGVDQLGADMSPLASAHQIKIIVFAKKTNALSIDDLPAPEIERKMTKQKPETILHDRRSHARPANGRRTLSILAMAVYTETVAAHSFLIDCVFELPPEKTKRNDPI